MEQAVKKTLSGWGRYPVKTCYLFSPDCDAQLAHILRSNSQSSYLARGLGRSYGDTALNENAGVVSQLAFNQIISFDESTGLLECAAGVSFAELIERFLPRGFFPPVVPGTKFVTVGGAIANDIHGKNHHRDGSIGNFIEEIKLLKPNGEIIACSPTFNENIFYATLGGIGLTGFILSARFRLRRVESAYVRIDYHKAQNLDDALRLFSSVEDQSYRYSVAWIDCLSRGRALGRAVLMRGDHVAAQNLPPHLLRRGALGAPPRFQLGIPFNLPTLTLNEFTIRSFNQFFFKAHKTITGQIVTAEKFFFPLDSISNWNRMYGRRGFVQYQAVFPLATSREGLVALLEQLSRSGLASFLAVLKRFGPAGAGLLSFPMDGYTLALDLPLAKGLDSVLNELDKIVLRCAGKTYLAKDSVLSPDNFAAMYPALPQFKKVKDSLDPARLISSSMSRRLQIA